MSKLGRSNSRSHHLRNVATSSLFQMRGSGVRDAGRCALRSDRGGNDGVEDIDDGGADGNPRGYRHRSSVGLNGSCNGILSMVAMGGSCRGKSFIPLN